MPHKRLLYVEGFINYTPTPIENAVEKALEANGLKLSHAIEPESWYGEGIFVRNVPNLSKPFAFQYQRWIDNPWLKRLGIEQDKFPNNKKYPIDYVQIHTNNKRINSNGLAITIETDEYDDIPQLLLHFDGCLSDIYYAETDSIAIPFLSRAFKQYTGKDYPHEFSEALKPQELGENPEKFVKALVEAFEPKTPQERRMLYRRSSIDIVRMVVDEFARTVSRDGK